MAGEPIHQPIHNAQNLVNRAPYGRSLGSNFVQEKRQELGLSADIGPICFKCGAGINGMTEYHPMRECHLPYNKNIHECGEVTGRMIKLFHNPPDCPFNQPAPVRRIRIAQNL